MDDAFFYVESITLLLLMSAKVGSIFYQFLDI